MRKLSSELTEGEHGQTPGAPLPIFEIKMWNKRTKIELRVQAIERAHWTFNQPTRGGIKSHLTYNEYPLRMDYLRIKDEFGFLSFPKWNFYKYLFNKDGELSAWFTSFTKPNSEKFLIELEKVLKK